MSYEDPDRELSPLLKGVGLSEQTRDMLADAKQVGSFDRLHLSSNEAGDKLIARMFDTNPEHRFCSNGALQWGMKTPGSKVMTKHPPLHGSWYTLQPSDYTVLRVVNSWQDSQVTFADEYTQYLYTDILSKFVIGEVNARRVYEWKERSIVPPTGGYEVSKTFPLNPYQHVGVANSLFTEGFALFMEQGTGKTPIVIARACADATKAAAEGRYFRALIVAPLNVKYNWVSEFHKFQTCRLNVQAIDGDVQQRLSKIRETYVERKPGALGGVLVMSYRTASDIAALFELLGVEIDLAVADESHTFKNPSTAVARGMFKLRDCSKRRMALTGTPVGNTPLDLWTQLEFLYQGCSGFTDFKSFRLFFANHVRDADSAIERLEAMQNVPLLKEKLARNSFIITKKEALPHLPEKTYDTLSCTMGKQQKAMYKSLAQTLALEIEASLAAAEGSPSQRNILINNALTKSLKLCQITSGFTKWDAVVDEMTGDEIQPSFIEATPENPKLDLLLEELKALPKHSKAIIWNCQTWTINMLYDRLTEEGYNPVKYYGSSSTKQRKDAIARFNDEAYRGTKGYDPSDNPAMCKVFLGNTAAAGPGLNLLGYPPGDPECSPMNATQAYRFSRNYSYLQEAQSDDRSHRVGTRKPVQITALLCEHSADEIVHEAVHEKKGNALDIQDVRDIMASIVGALK